MAEWNPRVPDIPVNDIVAYASGLPQDNGQCNRLPYPWPTDVYCTLENMFNVLANYDYNGCKICPDPGSAGRTLTPVSIYFRSPR